MRNCAPAWRQSPPQQADGRTPASSPRRPSSSDRAMSGLRQRLLHQSHVLPARHRRGYRIRARFRLCRRRASSAGAKPAWFGFAQNAVIHRQRCEVAPSVPFKLIASAMASAAPSPERDLSAHRTEVQRTKERARDTPSGGGTPASTARRYSPRTVLGTSAAHELHPRFCPEKPARARTDTMHRPSAPSRTAAQALLITSTISRNRRWVRSTVPVPCAARHRPSPAVRATSSPWCAAMSDLARGEKSIVGILSQAHERPPFP